MLIHPAAAVSALRVPVKVDPLAVRWACAYASIQSVYTTGAWLRPSERRAREAIHPRARVCSVARALQPPRAPPPHARARERAHMHRQPERAYTYAKTPNGGPTIRRHSHRAKGVEFGRPVKCSCTLSTHTNKAILHGLECEQGGLGHNKATTRLVGGSGRLPSIFKGSRKCIFRSFFDYKQTLCNSKLDLLHIRQAVEIEIFPGSNRLHIWLMVHSDLLG